MVKQVSIGVVSGLLAGLALDALMRAFTVRAPDGTAITMIGYVGRAIHPSGPWIGWVAYVLYGAVIGGVFAYILSDQTLGARLGAFWGVVYGLGWWVIACAAFVPILIGHFPFGEEAREALRQVAFPLFAGHVVYGSILGASWSCIGRTDSRARPRPADSTTRLVPH